MRRSIEPCRNEEKTVKNLTVLFLLVPLIAAADVVVPIDKVENSINIRLEPNATSLVIGQLKQGDSMPLVASTEGWNEVRLEGDATGFVSADWSTVEPDPVVEVEVEAEVEGELVAEIAEEAVEEAELEVLEEPKPVPVPEAEPLVEAEVTVAEEEIIEKPAPEPVVAPTATELSLDRNADRNFVVKVRRSGELGNSQIFDDGNNVGVGTNDPQQRLEVNGSIQIHDQNSSVAGLMITQSTGDTGYIMHNRASTLTIGAGSVDRITVDRDGNVGVGVSRPTHPLEMASGAYVSAGGVWTNRSSRISKENISALSSVDATAAVMALQPVSFNYTAEQGEDYVGFVAEDVPALLASSNRDSLSTMDIVAALTKVVQEQQRRIEELEARLETR